jgi:transcriptional regulator with XRE-family HTH domain
MMTATDFRVALAQLDIPQKRFAEMTGYRNETVSRWATGSKTIPPNVELIVRLMLVPGAMPAVNNL